jgi:phosphate transport system permease protein
MKTQRVERIFCPRLIKISGYSAIVFVATIFFFLLNEGLPALSEVSLNNLFSQRWYPIEDYFGLLPLIGGSIIVTLGATLISVPIGILSAIYIAEVAPAGRGDFSNLQIDAWRSTICCVGLF